MTYVYSITKLFFILDWNDFATWTNFQFVFLVLPSSHKRFEKHPHDMIDLLIIQHLFVR